MTTVTVPNTPLPIGSDGGVPIRNWDQDPFWKRWAKSEIYMGGDATGRYIPKIGDYVEDTDYHITYQVTALSDLWIPTLARITPKPIADVDSEDLLLAQTKDAFRVFVDKSVIPHRLQVDGRCYVNGRNASMARVFRGNPMDGKEEIVSLILDQSGLPIGTLIPLQKCYIPNGENVAQYYVPTAYTTTDMKNGEMAYVILYDDTGAILSSKELRVVESAWLRSTDLSIKAITGIALEGPLMSKLVPNRMEVPLNLTLNSINLVGVVNYNSGSPSRMNVDGNRFDLLGMGAFVPSEAGQKFEMDLKYTLASDEVSFTAGAVGVERFITKSIEVIVVEVENQLSVKLLPYPVWVNELSGYRLRWLLVNLDRNIMMDVSSLVEIGTDSPAFDPLLYGIKQQLTVALDLSKANSGWRAWRHPQIVSITLLRAGTEDGTKWRIGFDPNQTPQYGDNLQIQSRFINQNLYEVNLRSGFNTLADWLQAFYYNTKPLTNPNLETDPPIPDHVVLSNGLGQELKLKIEDYWNTTFQTTLPVAGLGTWFLKFVKQGPVDDLILSVAGAPVKAVTNW